MQKLKVLDLFSGIGGFSLGLERTGGFETVAFCEIEEFPRKVLNKHWPEVPIYEDVRQLTGDILKRDGISVDVITGGFPCQDISTAGKQAGMGEGTRSGLWSEITRISSEIRPDYIILENVTNLLSGPSEQRGGWFGRILGDLAKIGYDAEWHCIPASELGAHHHRDRVWIVAYPNKTQFKGGRLSGGIREEQPNLKRGGASRDPGEDVADSSSQRQQGQGEFIKPKYTAALKNQKTAYVEPGGIAKIWRVESELDRVANGVSDRMDRLAGIGNAVVPQIPELIGHAILESIQTTTAR